MNFKRLSLTDITIDIKRVPNKKTLIAAMEAAGKYKWCSVWFLSCLHASGSEPINCDGRCEEQVGEQFLGQEAYCAEEKGFT